MNNESPNQSATEPLIVGIDWADSKHDLRVVIVVKVALPN